MATLRNTTIDDVEFLELPQGTTAQRPGSPSAGMIRYNTDIRDTEFYDGTSWRAISDSNPEATGGEVVETDIAGKTYRIHFFKNVGNTTFTVSKAGEVEYLIVAGGGAGGGVILIYALGDISFGAASVVTVLTGGVPLIYGGQEVGVSQNIPFFSNSTFNWNANPELLNSYQDLFQFYSQSNVAKRGQNIVYPNDDIVCFKKVLGNEEVVIIVNTRNAIKNFNLPNELENTNWVDVLSQNTVSFSSQLTLEPYKFYILKQ